jgi:hypothetical protein
MGPLLRKEDGFMKKLCAALLAAVMLFSLCACGEKTPFEKAKQRAVEIGEQYLDYEITDEEAIERLEAIRVPETEGNGQLYLSASISALAFKIRTEASYEAIKDDIESIKKTTEE